MVLDRESCERARLARDARFDGRFFIGVTSTRIYCRPVCPAPQPKSAHVRYYPSAAAAAEAGFRPCLRCRPEASPETPAWLGTSTSISRALRLIGESALDEGGVEDLAGRLGIGSRHLRRLFLKHLGATPVAVAQTRRIHFAKRLIDDTSLPMTRIALASGFGSIRRFNAVFKNMYNRTPTELRRAGSPRENGRAGLYTFRLAYRPPYDWRALIEYIAAQRPKRGVVAGLEEYRRGIALDGHSGQIAVRPVRGKHQLHLEIEFPEPARLLQIIERVRRMFDLQADPAAIAGHLSSDRELKPLLRAYPGLRVPCDWDGEPHPDLLPRRYAKQFGARADAWRPWRAYAAMYVWKGSQ